MKTSFARTAAAIAATGALVAGCATDEQVEPSTSERGNIMKAIGEPAVYGPEHCEGNDCITFTVDSLEWVELCDAPLDDADGELLNVTLNATTAPSLDPSLYSGTFQTYNWSVVDGDGVTRSNAQGGIMTPCNPDPDGIGGEISPASTYNGTLQFDVPPGSTHLILDVFGDASWEWEIPQPVG